MLTEVACVVASIVVLCCSIAARPARARCPWDTDLRAGVRVDGRFECWRHPVAPARWSPADGAVEEWDGTFGRAERSLQPGGVLEGRVYCTNGRHPEQDGTSVWCSR